ncbi:hypothetical protein [Kitasatospora sp. NPDC088779]|uniref:hypothetical protein n=1 Tax=Kitasatospora sp. NPDC088779 TaxID=3154964 RepID=UPI003446C77F
MTCLSAGLARSLNVLGRPAEALQVITDANADTPQDRRARASARSSTDRTVT